MYAILPCLAERVVFLSRVPDLGVLRLGLCLGDLEDARGDFGLLEPLDPFDDCDDCERERCELRELLEVERDVDLERGFPCLSELLDLAGEPLGRFLGRWSRCRGSFCGENLERVRRGWGVWL